MSNSDTNVVMEEFDLHEVGTDLVGELTEFLGDKNSVKLTIDIQLPECFTGSPDTLKKAITDMVHLISDDLSNGSITIEITKKNEVEGKVNTQIQILGSGTFSGKSAMDTTFIESQALPFTIQRKKVGDNIGFEFVMGLTPSRIKKQAHKSSLNNKKILIAEDDEINALVFSSFLEEWGCVVSFAVNGVEAVQKAQQTEFDVILMDLYMPELNGNNATSKIREFNSTVPIITLTASSEDEDIRGSLDAGANGYLIKPISSSHLFQVLSRVLA